MKKQARHHGERRTQRIYIRVKDEEKKRIVSRAHDKGATISRVVIDAVDDAHFRSLKEHERRDSPLAEELRRIRSEIWHIGHNVNQIARMVNQELGATHGDVVSIHSDLDRCERALSKLDVLVSKAKKNERNECPSTTSSNDAKNVSDGARNGGERATSERNEE